MYNHRLQRLSVADRTPNLTESKVNFSAGSELLELYQTQWTTMHHMADQNAQTAEVFILDYYYYLNIEQMHNCMKAFFKTFTKIIPIYR